MDWAAGPSFGASAVARIGGCGFQELFIKPRIGIGRVPLVDRPTRFW